MNVGAFGLNPFPSGWWGGLLLGEPMLRSGERFEGTGLPGFWLCLGSRGECGIPKRIKKHCCANLTPNRAYDNVCMHNL